MTVISLAMNKEALVDDRDFEFLNQFSWWAKKDSKRDNYYVLGWANGCTIKMEHLILKPSEGFIVDHKNGNSLDNRRLNLRICTQKDNVRNRKKQRNNTTGYTGVIEFSRNKKGDKGFYSKIKVNGLIKYLGAFSTKEEAAIAYENAAIKYFGEFYRYTI